MSQLADTLQVLAVSGPFFIVGLRALAALLAVVPSSPIALAAGASQGPIVGTGLVLAGAEAGSLAAFLIGRILGQPFVEKRGWIAKLSRTLPGSWLLDQHASQHRLMLAVLVCRLLPGVNLDGLSYVAGMTRLAVWRFCLATFLGLLPYTLLLTGIGGLLAELKLAEAAAAVLLFGVVLACGAYAAKTLLRRTGPAAESARSS